MSTVWFQRVRHRVAENQRPVAAARDSTRAGRARSGSSRLHPGRWTMSDQSKGPEPEVGRERRCCSRGRYRQTRAGLQWAGGACDGTIRVPRPVPCPLLQILASPSCSRTIPLVRLAGPSLTARTVADVASTRCPAHSGHPLAPEAAGSAPCGPWNCSVECARSRRAPHHSRRRRRVAIPASARRSAPVGRPDMFHVKRHRPALWCGAGVGEVGLSIGASTITAGGRGFT
jgi:hypothetical protein